MDVGLGYPRGLGAPRQSREAQCAGLATANQCRSILPGGQDLRRGEKLTSPNGRFRAILQGDSNFVIYDGNNPLRAWGQNGTDVAAMQTDGNFVLYAHGSVAWSSNTNGNGGARLVMQDDGNLVVYATNNRVLWESETNGPRVYEPSRGFFPKLADIITAPGRSSLEKVIKASTGQDVTVTSVSVSPAQIAAAVQSVLSFVPVIGTGINAAIAAGAALAKGENITDAVVDGLKNSIPGGPIARQALESGIAAVKAITSGQNVGDAALAAAREALPGDEAKKAFDVGIAIAHGQNVQQAIIQGATSLAGKAVAMLAPVALPPALSNVAKSLPPDAVRVATALYNRPELQALAASELAKVLHTDDATVAKATQAVGGAWQSLASLTPTQQKALVAWSTLSHLTPEQQKALVALAAKKPIVVHEPKAHKAPPVVHEPSKKVVSGAKPGAPMKAYGPYPKTTGAVSAPPHHHPGGHPSHDGHRVFRGGKRIPGWGRWDGPWASELVTVTQTCQTWSDPVSLPFSMQSAAKVALGASGGRPTTLRGEDGALYQLSLERGVIVARTCTAFS